MRLGLSLCDLPANGTGWLSRAEKLRKQHSEVFNEGGYSLLGCYARELLGFVIFSLKFSVAIMPKQEYTISKEIDKSFPALSENDQWRYLFMETTSIGRRLKELRTRFGYTQAAISSLLGVDQSLISKYESGERQVSMDILESLGDLYCCDLVHTQPVASPVLQVAFRADSINASNMKAIQAVNRIVLNSVFMANLLKEDS